MATGARTPDELRHLVVSGTLGVFLGLTGALVGWSLFVEAPTIVAVRAEAVAPPDSTVAASTTVPATSTTTTAPSTTAPSTTTTSTTTTTTTTTPATTTEPATTLGVPAAPAPTTTVPVWPPYQPLPALDGIAALTGEPATEEITARPILAVKIDNSGRARPQWGLEQADVIFEENVEGTTRFVALYQTRYPDRVGPVRSARTGDLDLLSAMNRPVLGWSGGNPGVTQWVESAASSGVLVDFTAQRNGCYARSPSRRAPNNLLLDPVSAVNAATGAGPARPLWDTDGEWTPPDTFPISVDTTFTVKMDGLTTSWTWDAVSGTYLRSQAGGPHLTMSGVQLSARTVVELRTLHVPSPVDSRTPNPITTGGTTAVVHRGGVAIQAFWYRATAYDQFSFVDAATGTSFPLDTGTTFVQLVRDR